SGAQNSVEGQNFLRESLVSGENETGRARPRVTQIDQIEKRGDVRFERAFSAERVGEIEHEIGLLVRQLVDQRRHGVIDSQSARRMAVGDERGVQLIENRIHRRIERVLAVQYGDLHISFAVFCLKKKLVP